MHLSLFPKTGIFYPFYNTNLAKTRVKIIYYIDFFSFDNFLGENPGGPTLAFQTHYTLSKPREH